MMNVWANGWESVIVFPPATILVVREANPLDQAGINRATRQSIQRGHSKARCDQILNDGGFVQTLWTPASSKAR